MSYKKIIQDIESKIYELPIYGKNIAKNIRILNEVIDDLDIEASTEILNKAGDNYGYNIYINDLRRIYYLLLKFILNSNVVHDNLSKNKFKTVLKNEYDNLLNYAHCQDIFSGADNKNFIYNYEEKSIYEKIVKDKCDLLNASFLDGDLLYKENNFKKHIDYDYSFFVYGHKYINSDNIKTFISGNLKKSIEWTRKYKDKYIEISMVPNDFKVSDFSYYEIIHIISAIHYICCFHSVYHYNMMLKNKESTPSLRYKINNLINIIQMLTCLDDIKISRILSFLTLDLNNDAISTVIIKPLILIDGSYYFTNIFTKVLTPDSINNIILQSDKEKYNSAVNHLNRLKEKKMIEHLITLPNSKQNMFVRENFKYRSYSRMKIDCEFDIVIYDEINKFLLLCECKWFNHNLSYNSDAKILEKINYFQKDRKEKNEFIIKNYRDFTYACYGKILEVENIESIIIVQGTCPNTDNSTLPVINSTLFSYYFEKFNDLPSIFNAIKSNDYDELINKKITTDILNVFDYKVHVNVYESGE